ncbi:MAG: type I-F CRISPR-associated protein Csy1, partial [Gammaproteobacteria bacterium]|nr:type I-F CRISPR-associated protein Csy1 [Gammaproteobacteria bacterium]
QQKSDERYDPSNWFKKAIQHARHSITSHPSTYTHPDAKSTAILYETSKSKNTAPFLITGNFTRTDTPPSENFDVFGNAATNSLLKETYLFLSITAPDGKTVWNHFENESDAAKKLCAHYNQDFVKAQESFKKIFINPNETRTSNLLKQVYFPIGNGEYHLLSILTSSILIAETIKRIDATRFNEDSKKGREDRQKNIHNPEGFSEFFGLTQITMGGTKPQNISIVNTNNSGKSILIPSVPPIVTKRLERLPTSDFFRQSLPSKEFTNYFNKLHQVISDKRNNKHTREEIKDQIQHIIDYIILKALKLREDAKPGWSNNKHYHQLPLEQKIWLDAEKIEARQNNQDNWRDTISVDISRSIQACYNNKVKDAFTLSDGELLEIKRILKIHKEWL